MVKPKISKAGLSYFFTIAFGSEFGDQSTSVVRWERPVVMVRVHGDLPSRGEPKPVWLWWSKVDAIDADVDRCWQAFLRRFDIEHTFRLLKQTLGWTAPQLREPAAADRWTWLILAAHTQLRLARPLAQDLRRPWERPMAPERLTPARVRRGFRNLRATSGSPARAPKPSRPGPGRPLGSRNRQSAARHDVGLILVTGQAHQRQAHHKKGTKPHRTG